MRPELAPCQFMSLLLLTPSVQSHGRLVVRHASLSAAIIITIIGTTPLKATEGSWHPSRAAISTCCVAALPIEPQHACSRQPVG